MVIRHIRAKGEVLARERRELGNSRIARLRQRDMRWRKNELQDECERAEKQRNTLRAGENAAVTSTVTGRSLHLPQTVASILIVIAAFGRERQPRIVIWRLTALTLLERHKKSPKRERAFLLPLCARRCPSPWRRADEGR
jgi:hypothetical protein